MKLRAFGLVIFLVAALGVPAHAAHPNIMCVDVGENERYGTSNDDMIEYVRAVIGTNDADHEPPLQEGCVPIEGDFGGTRIDFEISGAADPDASDTPITPDMSCTIAAGDNNCPIEPPPSGGGTQTIRAWIDIDGNDATVEADTAEGPDQNTAPGDHGEPDATDVMTWIWTHGDPPPRPCGADDVCRQRTTIGHHRRFFGVVSTESSSCRPSTVRLRKVLPGPDRTVASVRTEDGRWKIARENARGRFYAVVTKALIHVPDSEPPFAYECTRDRSRTIEVP